MSLFASVSMNFGSDLYEVASKSRDRWRAESLALRFERQAVRQISEPRIDSTNIFRTLIRCKASTVDFILVEKQLWKCNTVKK